MLNSALTLATILLFISSVGLGFFSLFKNPQSKVVKLWFLMSMATGIWSGGFLFSLFAISRGDAEQLILYSKLLHLGAAFIPIFFIYFVFTFLYKEKQYKTFIIIGYILAAVFSVLSFTKFIVAGSAPASEFAIWIKTGDLYLVMVAYFWFYALAAFYFLYKGYRQSDGILKKKIFFILLTALVGFGGGGTNWLPQILGVYPYGMFIAWLYPFFIIYGIFVDEVKLKIKF